MPPAQPPIPVSCPHNESRTRAVGGPGTTHPVLVEMAPQQIWATLTPLLQDQTRHRLLRVLQEVAHDAR